MTSAIELTLSGPHAFEGPLDVLLAIVRRNHYPLDRLPLAEITRQFTAYLEQHRAPMEQQDVELAAEFFDAASWLVLLKSRALLPEQDGGSREEAPAAELSQALLAREQVAQWSGWLAEELDRAGLRIGRPRPPAEYATEASRMKREYAQEATSSPQSAPKTSAPTVQDAVEAARRAVAAGRAYASAEAAAAPGVAVADLLAALDRRLASLAPGAPHSTAPWFAALDPESAAILLLALLELARLGTLWVYQAAPGATLWVQKPPAAVAPGLEVRRRSRSRSRPPAKQGSAR